MPCLSAKKPFKIAHIFLMVSGRAFIFQMCIPCGKIFSMVSRSRSSVKVKYQSHTFSKNGHYHGVSVSQTHLVWERIVLACVILMLKEGQNFCIFCLLAPDVWIHFSVSNFVVDWSCLIAWPNVNRVLISIRYYICSEQYGWMSVLWKENSYVICCINWIKSD